MLVEQKLGDQGLDPEKVCLTFVQPPIDPRTVELETTFDIAPGDAVTVVATGLVETRTLRVVAIHDDLTPSGERARMRLINAMSDFPAPLDL